MIRTAKKRVLPKSSKSSSGHGEDSLREGGLGPRRDEDVPRVDVAVQQRKPHERPSDLSPHSRLLSWSGRRLGEELARMAAQPGGPARVA